MTTARMVTAAMTGTRGLSAATGTAWGGGTEESSPASEGGGGGVDLSILKIRAQRAAALKGMAP